MGNQTLNDNRFDKPPLESLVDLINYSNKSYIKYGEIEGDQVTPIADSESELLNTTVRIRLADAGENSPYSTMTYGRLNIAEYLPEPGEFYFEEYSSLESLFEQLQLFHRIRLHSTDTSIEVGVPDEEGNRTVTFTPAANHMVWIGQLVVTAKPFPIV